MCVCLEIYVSATAIDQRVRTVEDALFIHPRRTHAKKYPHPHPPSPAPSSNRDGLAIADDGKGGGDGRLRVERLVAGAERGRRHLRVGAQRS